MTSYPVVKSRIHAIAVHKSVTVDGIWGSIHLAHHLNHLHHLVDHRKLLKL